MFICVTLYQWHSSFTHYVLDSFVSCLATKGGFLLVVSKVNAHGPNPYSLHQCTLWYAK